MKNLATSLFSAIFLRNPPENLSILASTPGYACKAKNTLWDKADEKKKLEVKLAYVTRIDIAEKILIRYGSLYSSWLTKALVSTKHRTSCFTLN